MKSFFLIVLLFSGCINAATYNYQFKWLGIPVSEFIIFKDELIFDQDRKKHNGVIKFYTKSIGPLKVFRNYFSEVGIVYSDHGWVYNLNGSDRGVPELKEIEYFYDNVPSVIIFEDDKGSNAIEPIHEFDVNASDPFTVLINTVHLLKNENKCLAKFNVFDGKRRYIVNIKPIELKNFSIKNHIQEKLIHCSFSIDSLNTLVNEEFLSKRNKWPFNKEGRTLIVSFSSVYNFMPIEFQLKTPIGSIKGNLIESY